MITNHCGRFSEATFEDSAGNIYVGSGPHHALTKFDPNGSVVWTWGRPGGEDCSGHITVKAISVDELGNIYIAGSVWGNVKIPGLTYGPTSPGGFFAKLNSSREVVFVKYAHNLGGDKPFFHPNGTWLLAGNVYQNAPLRYEELNLSSSGENDIALVKVNGTGAVSWARRGGGSGWEELNSVAVGGNGDVYSSSTTFFFEGGGTFGMGGLISENASRKPQFLVRLDSTGNVQWITNVSSSYNPNFSEWQSSAVAASDVDSTVVWAGDFTETLKLATPPVSATDGRDAFIAKFRNNGSVVWARTFAGITNQSASTLAVDASGNIYCAARFSRQIIIGTNTFTSRGKEDSVIIKLSPEGTLLWTKQVGYTGNDILSNISFTRRGELLVVGVVEAGFFSDGTFQDTVGSADGFIAKFHPEGGLAQFTSHPESVVASGGMRVEFRAIASSPGQPVRYQWWFDASLIPGATNSTLVLSNITSASAGRYYVIASTDAGSVQSQPAILTYTDSSTLRLSIHPSLEIFGTVGRTYRIEYATQTASAAQWITATNITLSTSPQLWLDRQSATNPHRYYRVTLEP